MLISTKSSGTYEEAKQQITKGKDTEPPRSSVPADEPAELQITAPTNWYLVTFGRR
jgi:hypothetical protein